MIVTKEHSKRTGWDIKNWIPSLEAIGDRLTKAQGNRTDRLIQDLSGVSDTVIGKCKKGKHVPNLNLLCYFAIKEGFSLDWLILGQKGLEGEDNIDVWIAKALDLPLEQELQLLAALAADVQKRFAATQLESQYINAQEAFPVRGRG